MAYLTLAEQDGKYLVNLETLENTPKNKAKLDKKRTKINANNKRVVFIVESATNPNENSFNRKTRRQMAKKQRALVNKIERGAASKEKREMQSYEANVVYKETVREQGVFLGDGIVD